MALFQEQVFRDAANYNEAAVRFHIIDPILRQLGYPGAKETYIFVEERLDYPYYHIGHKSKKKDVPLGFPDYRAGLQGRRGSFIVEAKSPRSPISEAVIEQAHSYAAHAQVGANYFVVCDGVALQIYETLSGHGAAPTLDVKVNELNDRYHEVASILHPSNLARLCHRVHDTRLGLVQGWPSSVGIALLRMKLSSFDYRMIYQGTDITDALKKAEPQIEAFEDQMAFLKHINTFGSGRTKRNEDGRIEAIIDFEGINQNNLEAMKLLGMQEITFETGDRFISTNKEKPTIFEARVNVFVREGECVPATFDDKSDVMEHDVYGNILMSAAVFIENDEIIGDYFSSSEFVHDIPTIGPITLELDLRGSLSMKLDI